MTGEKVAYVTGSTGFIGSHLAERLVRDGWRVLALARDKSDTSLVESLGVEVVRGDVTDRAESLAGGMRGATHVFHCAAHVDEWGPLDGMVRINVDGLRHVLDAARSAGVKRVVFLGSCAVYGAGDQVDLDESAPFVETGDNYNTTKIACERLLSEAAREGTLETVSVRAPYVYGERDRQFLPRVLETLRDGTWKYLDGGRRPMTLASVGNVVEACVRAATCDEAAGEAFIVTDGASITRRQMVDVLCDELGYARPTRSVPRWLAGALCPLSEGWARLLGKTSAPRLNRFRVKFASTHLTFDISKAVRVLGYAPKGETLEGLRAAARWFRENRPELLSAK